MNGRWSLTQKQADKERGAYAFISMHEIRPMGGYLEVDQDGYIVKQASIEKIPGKWKPLIEEAVSAYKNQYKDSLLSVYVRGSVAKGEAIDGISDLDTIAVTTTLPAVGTSWGEAFSVEMVKKYPFVEKVEILAQTLGQALDPNRGVHIMLKTQAVCVYGKDLSDGIPKLRPGKEACQHVWSIQSELQATMDFFEDERADGPGEARKKVAWILKRIVRTGFELVMEREQKYTRDLYPCYESFSKYYPEKQALMRETLYLALNPMDKPEKIKGLLKSWMEWMPREIERIFFGEQV